MTNQATVPANFMVYRPRRIFGRCELDAKLATRLNGTAKRIQIEQQPAKEFQC